MQELALLGVFAHPDDEQTMSGTLAQAARNGIKTGLICATRGEVGEISDPALATAENLGTVREGEMRAAAAVLGVKYLWFLDYRDSGMDGTADNKDKRSFINVPREEALGKIVKLIREFKPTVIVTFEPGGGYGHPDHIFISSLTAEAFDAAADAGSFPDAGEPWKASRLFYASFPRSMVKKMGEYFAANGMDSGVGTMDPDKMGLPDEEITNTVNTSQYVDLKMKSLNQHQTQMSPDSPFNKMPPEIMHQLRASEHFAWVKGVPISESAEARGDLFAGLTTGEGQPAQQAQQAQQA